MKLVSCLVIQCRATGRFLLRRCSGEEEWNFTGTMNYESLGGTPFLTMIDEVGRELNCTIDGVEAFMSRDIPYFLHAWVDSEIAASSVDCEYQWCSLFNFPEHLNELVDQVLKNKMFLDRILKPDG